MENIIGYIVTGIVSFITGFTLKFLGPKSKLVYWELHNFLFELETSDKTKALLHTHTLVIQNIGRKIAEDIQIVHKERPDLFKLNPALDHLPKQAPTGEYMISVQSLAPMEFFTIEFLSYTKFPHLLFIRSKDGHASLVKMQPVRTFPKWYLFILRILVIVGSGTILYWLIQLCIKFYRLIIQ